MKHLLLIIILLTGYAGVAAAFGTGELGCSGDCTSCHKVTKQEAQDAVKKLDPELMVDSVIQSPVPGLYQMVIAKGKEKGIAYLDFSKRYLIQGTVVDTGNKVNITSQSMLELLESQVVDVSKIRLDNALRMGNPKGTKHLYLFSDPDCPYCPKAHAVVQQLIQKMPELAVHILLFPLEMHPDAAWKTNAIIATSKKDMAGALKMLEDSYQKKAIHKNPKAKDYAADLKKMATELEIKSTPVFVYANGKVGLGAKTVEEVSDAVVKNVASK
jgi:thiol:disulfide interchange protein DsbC